jgi:hypothetical protein
VCRRRGCRTGLPHRQASAVVGLAHSLAGSRLATAYFFPVMPSQVLGPLRASAAAATLTLRSPIFRTSFGIRIMGGPSTKRSINPELQHRPLPLAIVLASAMCVRAGPSPLLPEIPLVIFVPHHRARLIRRAPFGRPLRHPERNRAISCYGRL